MAAQTPKNKVEVVDISVHSASGRSGREGDMTLDAQQVLENILIDEGRLNGQEAGMAVQEALRSGELRIGSAGVHSQAARSGHSSGKGILLCSQSPPLV